MHAQSLAHTEHAVIAAVCDSKEERAKAAADAYHCRYYTDYKDMIDSADLHAVHICTPHYLHAPMAVYAAGAKKHVMTEKPMSIDYGDAVAMVNAAREHGVCLGVIFQNHYNPGSVLIKETLQSGALGRVISGRITVAWNRDDAYYSESDWKGTWEKEGGGVIINQAIHTLDLMRWFADSGVDYVDASIHNRMHGGIEVEDCAEGIIAFKNGVTAAFYCNNYSAYDAPVALELYCEKGVANIDGDCGTVTFHDGGTLTADTDADLAAGYGAAMKDYWGVSHVKQIKNFYEALSKGVPPDITGDYAAETQKMIAAVYRSGKTGKRVALD
jgi:predicted dehydrogenase